MCKKDPARQRPVPVQDILDRERGIHTPPVPSSSEVWAALAVMVVIATLLGLFVIPVLTMVF